ncbi:type II secretion system minor pseudopilin GspK [Ketobacter sp.]|uniref:type II secretion system minor pseudopilin GspK n=1 Tax=Ketobacter sp. TaxID=2083498 RepID=UPI0025BB2BC2|nr:type II secretion system minor pseudopilin GspK [Ketobacter sp.]
MDRKQAGTVLITVIMMVAIAALLVTDMVYRQKLDIKRTSALLSRDQAFQYLLGAEELANLTLSEDLKQDNDRNEPAFVDTLAEDWAEPTNPFPVAGGFIQGRVIDLQSRFNVNSIMASDANVAKKQRERFRRLLDQVGIPVDKDSNVSTQMLAERVLDWLDSDQEPTGFDGKEDLDYLGLDRPYRAANMVLWDISELMLIEGFTPNDIAQLADYVSFLPPDVALNINTADVKVLDAYDLGLPGVQIDEERKKTGPGRHDGGFLDLQALDDLLLTAATPQNNEVESGSDEEQDTENGAAAPGEQQNNKAVGNFSVNSEYYLLEAEAVINEKPVLMRSILFRPALKDGASNKDIKIKTLSRKLEDPLKRV